LLDCSAALLRGGAGTRAGPRAGAGAEAFDGAVGIDSIECILEGGDVFGVGAFDEFFGAVDTFEQVTVFGVVQGEEGLFDLLFDIVGEAATDGDAVGGNGPLFREDAQFVAL